MNINLFNTLTKKKEKLIPINSSAVKMYACGPTLYSNPHIGNFRPIIVFDILFRVLRLIFGEDSVRYVRNITDIDDKIIGQRVIGKHSERFAEDAAENYVDGLWELEEKEYGLF